MWKSGFGPKDRASSLGQKRQEKPGGASRARRLFMTVTTEIFIIFTHFAVLISVYLYTLTFLHAHIYIIVALPAT